MQPNSIITVAVDVDSLNPTKTIRSNLSNSLDINSVIVTSQQVLATAALTGPQGPQGTAGVGVPTGGTTGQVLAKIDATNYNTQWISSAAGSAITALTGDISATGPGSAAATLATVNTNVGTFGNSTTVPVITANAKGLITAVSTATISTGTASPLTTKGDLYGFDTANNRIPIGANNFVLTADSTQALGLKWAAIPTQTATGTAGGDLTGTYPNPTLKNTGTAGTYGSASSVPVTTYDAQGRETAVTPTAIQITESQVTNLVSDLAAKEVTANKSNDSTFASPSATTYPTTQAVASYVSNIVTGALILRGSTDASTNPNYPSAKKGDTYIVTVAGRIGGASGPQVDVGDEYFAIADNAGGTQAAVGASWDIIEHNLVGALLSANNLSDVANTATAFGNIKQNATTGATGVIQLAGDLAGTATSPALTAVGTSGTFGSATQVPVYTTDTKGRITSTTNTSIQIAESQVTNLVSDLATKQPNLTVAASQTTSFTASANTYYPVNATSGAITVTLPATNTQGQQIVVKKMDASTNIVTLSGTINGTASSSLPLRLQDQGKVLIADGTGNWNIYAGDLSIATTDARYVNIGGLSAGTNITITGGGTTSSPYVINSTGGSGNTTNITVNTTKIDTVNAGTTAYGTLSFTPNGTNTVATVSNGSYATGTLRVWLYGQLQTVGTTGDVTETNPATGTFTFAVAPPSGAIIVVAYVISSTSSGNVVSPYAVKSTAYTLGLTDKFIEADASGGTFNVTLPSVSSATGYEFCIKKVDSSANTVTVVGTIDGATNYSLTAQYKYVRVASNGTTWRIWGNN